MQKNAPQVEIRSGVLKVPPQFGGRVASSIALCWLFPFLPLIAATLVTYPGPVEEPASEDYLVSVDAEELFVYTSFQFGPPGQATTNIEGRAVSPVSFCYFDFDDGPVAVSVTITNPDLDESHVVIRPLARGIDAQVTNGVVSFSLTEPGPITVQPGGALLRPLHIFANPIETDIPDENDPDVIYFGPGTHHVEELPIGSDQTLYLAGGAVVYAAPSATPPLVLCDGVWSDNVTIRGRGILCGRKRLEASQRVGLIELRGDNLVVEGIILRESSRWTLNIINSTNVLVDNVKVVAHYQQSDGIIIGGTSRAEVRNSFCHNADDAMGVKVWIDMGDVLFESNTVWSTVAGAYGLTNPSDADLSNVVFRNCTVINAADNISVRAPIGLELFGYGHVDGFLFEEITIEYIQGSAMPPIKVINNWDDWHRTLPSVPGNPYVLLSPDPAKWRPRGTIRNVTFRNIQVLDTLNEDVVVMADAAESSIRGVTFEEVVVNGRLLLPGDNRIKTNDWVHSLAVIAHDRTIVVSTNGHGRVTPGEAVVAYGDDARFHIQADPHYHIESIRTNHHPVTGYPYTNGFREVDFGWSNISARTGSLEVFFGENAWAHGTPETWLAISYPSTNNYFNAALSDTDGDGLAAWQEYVVGSDPADATSSFGIVESGFVDGSNYIKWLSFTNWTTAPYRVERLANLTMGTWEIADDSVERTPPMNCFSETDPYPDAATIYRVVAPDRVTEIE